MLVYLLLFSLVSPELPPQPIAVFDDERKCVAVADAQRKEHAKFLAEQKVDFACFTRIHGERV